MNDENQVCLENSFKAAIIDLMEEQIPPTSPSTPPKSKEDQIIELLSSISADQQIIREQNETMLQNEKNKKIWGIVKWVVIIGLFFFSMWSLPAMISSMVGNLGGGALDQLLQY